MYDLDIPNGEIVSPSVDHPLTYCDRGVVFRTNEDGAWVEITTWRDELMQWVKDSIAKVDDFVKQEVIRQLNRDQTR